MKRTYLRQILISGSDRLLITADGLNAALMEAFPPTATSLVLSPKTYKEESKEALAEIMLSMKSAFPEGDVCLTDDFASQELPYGSIAYHRVWGIVTADCRWCFSSKQLERDLLDAEANPAISCHFLHVNSPGGEAWYLDRLSETMRSLSKPVVVLAEDLCCSAAYYIACHADVLAGLTANDTFGCIGTMVRAYDISGWLEKNGIKVVTAKSSKSDLKNKKYEDLTNGKPEQYIEEVLDPLTEQFIGEVRSQRSVVGGLPDDDPVLRGESYDTSHAIEKGLADCTMTMAEAVARAVSLGKEYAERERIKKSALNYVL